MKKDKVQFTCTTCDRQDVKFAIRRVRKKFDQFVMWCESCDNSYKQTNQEKDVG